MINWSALAAYLAIQSITPGPNNLTCLYLGADKGIKATLPFVAGSMSMFFVKAVLCGLLNLILANLIPSIMSVLKWIGAAYMIYLAVLMALSGWKKESGSKSRSEASFLSGVILQIVNGKSWIATISMYVVYIIPFSTAFKDILLASALFIALASAASFIWAGFGNAIKSFIDKYKKPFGIVMGLSLIYCAVQALI